MRLLLLKNKTTPVDPYHEVFQESGHCPEFLPLLNHSPISLLSTAEYLLSPEFLEDTKAFIITSQRAVEVFHACLEQIDRQDPRSSAVIRSKIGYTVGPATEKILKDNGFTHVKGGSKAGNGSKLADLIINDINDRSQSIVFFTGVIRKDIIPVKLKENHLKVKEIVIYKTEPREDISKNFHLLCKDEVHWIIFFSPQGTEGIVQFIRSSPCFKSVRIACIGPTTHEYLCENGIATHVVAKKPTAESLLSGLQEYFK